MTKVKIESLTASLVESIVSGTDVFLVDVEYVKEGPQWVLRVFVDKPQGIDIDDCRDVSMALSAKLDELDPIPDGYSLEVSSPGLERPLKTKRDYTLFVGRKVNVKTYAPFLGRKEFEGTLKGFREDGVEIEEKGELVVIPLEAIAKARLAVEL